MSTKDNSPKQWPDRTTALRGIAAYLCAGLIAALCTYHLGELSLKAHKIASLDIPLAHEAKRTFYINIGLASFSALIAAFCFLVAGAGFREERKRRRKQ